MNNELKTMRDSLDKIWGITWKCLAAFGTVLLMIVTWNITLMQRTSSIENSLTQVNTAITTTAEKRAEIDTETIDTLKNVQFLLEKMSAEKRK